MYHEYSCVNGKIQLEAGSHIPTVITAKRTGSHRHYELVEYWTPGDGSDYAKDIKAKFPWYLHSKALDSQRYVDEQIAFCENAAKEYFKDADEYVGGPTNIGKLKEKYPHFFNVSTDGGLTVYIWQMSANNYQCYLINRGVDMFADQSFAFDVGATIAEMRAILTTYDIDQKDIYVLPVRNPLSSYYYEIDDAYRSKVQELFWTSIPYTPKTASYVNTAIANVLNEKYQAKKPDGLIHIENYYLLASETASGTPLKGDFEHLEIVNVYLLVYHMKYSVNGGYLEEHEGDFTPTAITFAIDENGEYTLEDYWTPQTGANYEKDVRSKFPGSSADEALNTEKYSEDMIKENWQMANNVLSRIHS